MIIKKAKIIYDEMTEIGDDNDSNVDFLAKELLVEEGMNQETPGGNLKPPP